MRVTNYHYDRARGYFVVLPDEPGKVWLGTHDLAAALAAIAEINGPADAETNPSTEAL